MCSFSSEIKNQMIVYTYDVETKQVVYAITNASYQPLYLTTSITESIRLIQKNA
jgi:hypothetical protein